MMSPDDPHWDAAIADAKARVTLAKTNLTRLKSAIRIFEKNKAEGVPWPGSNRAAERASASMQRWTQAIADAADTIAKCERKIQSMRAAIRCFEEAIEEGAEYPMES